MTRSLRERNVAVIMWRRTGMSTDPTRNVVDSVVTTFGQSPALRRSPCNSETSPSSRSHTWIATIPSSLMARAISASALLGSEKNISAAWQRTTSNDRARNGRPDASPSRHSISGRRRSATASIAGFRSRPTTDPLTPTRSAAMRATTPVPHATSRTRSPATDAGGVHQHPRPWLEQRRNEHRLVGFGGVQRELERFRRTHGGSPPRRVGSPSASLGSRSRSRCVASQGEGDVGTNAGSAVAGASPTIGRWIPASWSCCVRRR